MNAIEHSWIATDCGLQPSIRKIVPCFERVNYAKNVKQLLNDRNLFWVLFCKAQYLHHECQFQDLRSIDTNINSWSTLHPDVFKDDDRSPLYYSFNLKRNRLRHLKEVVEKLRLVLVKGLNSEQTLHFVRKKSFHHKAFENVNSYGRSNYSTDGYDFGDWFALFLNEDEIAPRIHECGLFCEMEEFASYVVPGLLLMLDSMGSKLEVKKESENRYASTNHDLYHFRFKLQGKTPLNPTIVLPNRTKGNETPLQLDIESDAKEIHAKFLKIPDKIASLIEKFQGYVQKLKLPESIDKHLQGALCKMSYFATALGAITAWNKLFDTNKKRKEIENEIKKIKVTERLASTKNKFLSEILKARIDCLEVQKEKIGLTLVGKSIKFLEKIISNVININQILLTLDVAWGCTAFACVASNAALIGLWLISALVVYKLTSFLHKNWSALPHILNKYKNDLLKAYENLYSNYCRFYLLYVKKISKTNQNDIENVQQKIKASSERYLKYGEKSDECQQQIVISYFLHRFKTLKRDDVNRLYNLVREEFICPDRIRSIRKFLLKQGQSVRQDLTPEDILNYITANF